MDAPHYCSVPETVQKARSPSVSEQRLRAIYAFSKLWVNGTVIHYYLFPTSNVRGTTLSQQHDAVIEAIQEWDNLGLGLQFRKVENPAEAEIRVSFENDGSWSYIGTDAIDFVSSPNATMNFGWNISKRGGSYDTALHEVGHMLGLHHEHQNPNAGIVWNEPEVYRQLGGPPNNWPPEVTFRNIIAKLPLSEVRGGNWDRNSVMHYPFGPNLILSPPELTATGVRPAGGLSSDDKKYALLMYPKLDTVVTSMEKLRPFVSVKLQIKVGEQQDFALQFSETRSYTFLTFGNMDSRLILFEKPSGSADPRFVAGDEDSGEDRNARFRQRLYKDRAYILRCRMIFGAPGTASIMFF